MTFKKEVTIFNGKALPSSLSYYLNIQLCVAWSGDYARSTESVISGLTSNEALRTVLCYSWLDHGTPPKDSPFLARSIQ